MKCSVCGVALDLAKEAAFFTALLTPYSRHVCNTHRGCLAGVVGSAPVNKLESMLVKSGWRQVELFASNAGLDQP